MNLLKIVTSICFMFMTTIVYGQIKIGDDVNNINPASLLELESTDQGILPPRLTSPQRDAQTSWVEGHIIYNTTEQCFQFYDGSVWICLRNEANQGAFAGTFTCDLPDLIANASVPVAISTSPASGVVIDSSITRPTMDTSNYIGIRPTATTITATATGFYRTNFNLPDASRYIGQSFVFYFDIIGTHQLSDPGTGTIQMTLVLQNLINDEVIIPSSNVAYYHGIGPSIGNAFQFFFTVSGGGSGTTTAKASPFAILTAINDDAWLVMPCGVFTSTP